MAQAQLSALAVESPSDTRSELESARIAVAKYERILGPNADSIEDVRTLGERLSKADKDNASLRLQLSESEAATNSLYTEIDGLSGLYEELDKKVKSRCFELKDGEQKIQRLITEVSDVAESPLHIQC